MIGNTSSNHSPPRCVGFNGQYINGVWRPSRTGTTLVDINPFSGETIAEISAADADDLDGTIAAPQQHKRRGRMSLPKNVLQSPTALQNNGYLPGGSVPAGYRCRLYG